MAFNVASLTARLTADTSGLERGLKRSQDEIQKTAGLWQDAAGRWRTASGQFATSAEQAAAGVGKLSPAAKQAGDDVDRLAERSRSAGGIMQGALSVAIGSLAAMAVPAIGSMAASAISLGSDFQATTNRIQAVAGITATDMVSFGGQSVNALQAVQQQALKLGQDLPLSAKQAADGILELVAGGMTLEGALAASTGTAQLAAAQMISVGDAASITSSLLNSFGLAADQAGYAADILSQISNASASGVLDIGESMKYVGGVAGALSQPLTDVGAAIGLMANSGIKGSQAGTALRAVLTELASPGEKTAQILSELGVKTTDASGKMLPFMSIADQMRGAMGNLSDSQKTFIAQTIAGTPGMAGLLAVLNASPASFDAMRSAMENASGATAAFGAATGQGFGFAFEQLKGSIETVLVQGFLAVEPALTSAANAATGLVNGIGAGLQTVAPVVQDVISLFGAAFNFDYSSIDSLSASLSGIVGTGATEAIVAIGMAFGELPQTASGALNLVQGIVTGNLDQIKSGLSTLDDTSVFDFLGENAESALDSLSQSLLPLSGYFQTIGSSAAQVGAIISGSLGVAFQTAGQIASVVLAGLPGLFLALAGPAQTIAGLVGSLWVAAFSSAGSIIQSVLGILPGLVSIGMSVLTSMAGLVGSVLAGAYQTLAPIAISVFQGIASVVQMVMPAVLGLASAVGSFLATAFQVLQVIALSVFSAIQPYIPALQNAISTVAGVVGSVLAGAFNFVSGVIQNVVIPAFILAGAWLANNLPVAIQAVAGFFQNVLWPAVQNVAGWFVGTLIPLLGELATWLGSTVTGALAVLSEFWQTHGDQIVSIAQTAWDTIRGAVDVALGVVSQLMSAFTSAREGDWRGFGEKLRELWDAAWDGIKSAVTRIGPQIVSAVGSVISDAKTKFTEIDWPGIGQSIIDGVARGISGAASVIAEAARRAASAALDAARGFLGIASPSAVMADQVGAPMAQGLAAGFLSAMQGQGTQAIVSSLSNLVGGLASMARELIDSSNMFGEGLGNETERLADLSSGIQDVERIVGAVVSVHAKIVELQAGGGLAIAGGAANIGRQIAEWALAVVTEMSTARLALGPGVIDGIKAVGDGASAATAVANNSLSLLRALGDVLAFDFGSVNLQAGRDALRQLASNAVFLIGGAAEVALGIREINTSGLAPLRGAVEALSGQAQATLTLINLAVDAMRFDFAAVNFGRARDTLRDLVIIALFFLRDAAQAALAIKDIDTSGLTPLRAALDELRAVGETTMGMIRFAVDTLRFDFAAVNFGRARDMLRDFVVIAVFFMTQAAQSALSIKDINTSGLAPLRAASDELRAAGEATLASIRFALDALKFDYASVNFGQLRDLFRDLVTIAVFFVRSAAQAALAILDIDTSGLALVRSASETLRGAAEQTYNLIRFALDAMKSPPPVNLAPVDAFLRTLIQAGISLASTANAVIGTWTIEVKPALGNVKTILDQSLGILNSVVDITTLILGGGAVQRLLSGGVSPITQAVNRLVEAGRQIAIAAQAAIGTWTVEVNPYLERLGTILGNALSGLKNTFDIIDAIDGRGDFAGVSLSDLRPTSLQPEYSPLQMRIMSLLYVGKQIAVAANTAMIGWGIEVRPALDSLGKMLAASLAGLKNTFDIVDAIQGRGDFAGIPISDLRPTALQPEYSPFQMRIMSLIYVGKQIAIAANTAMIGWTTETNGALVALGKILSDSLGVLGKTLDINALLGGKAPPRFNLPTLLSRVETVVWIGTELARVAIAGIGTWSVEVIPPFSDLAAIIENGMNVITNVLDLNKLLGGKVPPRFNLPVLLSRIQTIVWIGTELARAAIAGIGTWAVEVVPPFETLAGIIAKATDVITNTLDLNTLLGGKVPPRFNLPVLTSRIQTVVWIGTQLAQAAIAGIGTWQGEVNPAFEDLKGILSGGLGIIKDVLDMNTLLGKEPPVFNVTDLVGRVGSVVYTGTLLATAANNAIGTWRVEVIGNFTDLGKILSDGLGIIKDVLDFAKLGPALASFRGLDMGVLGPKLDLLISNAIAIAQEFGRKATSANIPEAFAKAGEQIAKLFGDAFGVLKDSLDLGKILSDRETVTPSLSQVQPKLDALFALVEGVVSQFAARAAALAQRGVNTEAAASLGEQVKGVFEALREVSSAVKDFTGIAIDSSGFNNIDKMLFNVFSLFDRYGGQAANVNEVTGAITSVLGGLTALSGTAGLAAGVSWGTQFAAGLRSVSDDIQAAFAESVNPGAASGTVGGTTGGVAAPASSARGANGGGINANVYVSDGGRYVEKEMNVSITQIASESTLAQSAGSLAGLDALYGR